MKKRPRTCARPRCGKHVPDRGGTRPQKFCSRICANAVKAGSESIERVPNVELRAYYIKGIEQERFILQDVAERAQMDPKRVKRVLGLEPDLAVRNGVRYEYQLEDMFVGTAVRLVHAMGADPVLDFPWL